MANLRKGSVPDGVSPLAQRNLIGSFNQKQVILEDRNNPNSDIKGYYVAVQLDQTGVPEDKADSNPFLNSKVFKGRKGEELTGHSTYYSKRDVDAMMSTGQNFVDSNGITHMAFKGDLHISKDKKTGESTVHVFMPMEIKETMPPEDTAKAEAYNARHPFGLSDNKDFGPSTPQTQVQTVEVREDAVDSKNAVRTPVNDAPVVGAESEHDGLE